MNNLFIPYELALKLKEKGFDEPCLARYRHSVFRLYNVIKEHKYNSDPISTSDISAPIYQQVIDWFNEKHNLKIHEGDQYGWFIRGKLDGAWISLRETFTLDEAIKEALKII